MIVIKDGKGLENLSIAFSTIWYDMMCLTANRDNVFIYTDVMDFEYNQRIGYNLHFDESKLLLRLNYKWSLYELNKNNTRNLIFVQNDWLS